MIEALACATPVIAFRRGSVGEILDDGVTAFIVEGVQEAAEAVQRISSIKREKCRSEFERPFCSASMCMKYIEAYEMVLAESTPMERRTA
jgi:glycosyltransferase involved in cell wall biosynthesis